MAEGAGGALIGGEDDPVARQGLFDLGRQRGGRKAYAFYTPWVSGKEVSGCSEAGTEARR